MERIKKQLSIADVAGWGSGLVTFGLVQGALYLQSYWSQFGVDPFQFVAVSEIALAGLAGIGVVLGLMLVAILLGGWLEGKIVSTSPDRRVLTRIAPVALLIGTGAIIWWASAWTILLGGLLTVVCLVVVMNAPAVPSSVKSSPLLTSAVAMLVYVSTASSWLGAERAEKIIQGDGKYVASVTVGPKTLDGLSLIGRLGDTYAFWDMARKATLLLPASDLKSLEIARGRAANAPDRP